jgi:uncharacterized protein YndB with AHSA1/START domain
MTSDPKDELTIVRVLNAPREKVWRACSEVEALTQWWGLPDDASMLACTIDFRVGGALHIGVQMPGRPTMWFKSTYREIVEGETIVMVQQLSDATGNLLETPDWPPATITLRFEDVDGKTRLTVVHSGIASGLATIENFRGGWSESLDRLVRLLTHA